MAKIPIMPIGRVVSNDPLAETILDPKSLEVSRELDTGIFLVRIGLGDHAQVVPLSAPTAMQLGRALRRAVRDYLNGPEKE